ncbi:MAG: hypothetical protein RL230_2636 [Pseudomonadota bacterium]
MHCQKVTHEAREASISIGERVDKDKAMTEANGDLMCGEGAIGNPEFRVINRLGEIKANVARACSVVSGPSPSFAKQALMKLTQERFIQHVALSSA